MSGVFVDEDCCCASHVRIFTAYGINELVRANLDTIAKLTCCESAATAA